MVKNLRKLRVSRGISQQQLADVIGTSQQSINKYENHSVEPDIHALIKLADYFETTVDYLVGHTPLFSNQPIPEGLDLSKAEIVLIREYRMLSKDEKDSIKLICKNYLKNKRGNHLGAKDGPADE